MPIEPGRTSLRPPTAPPRRPRPVPEDSAPGQQEEGARPLPEPADQAGD